MNLSLYEITNAFPKLLENEEISDKDKEAIEEELGLLLQQKSQNVIGYVKNVELTIKAIEEEERRLLENRKALENRLQRFKTYVKECMENNNITKIETELGTLSIAKNPISVEILDEDKIPEKFKEEKIMVKVDKKAILDNFKETGEIVSGININTTKTNLRIK